MIEDLRLAALSRRDQVLIETGENVLADLSKLGLDLLAVLFDESNLGLVALGFLLLLNGCNDPPRSAASTNNVLVSDGEEISLFDGELLVCGGHGLHILDHLCEDIYQFRVLWVYLGNLPS